MSREIFLLGAGASIPAGIPDSFGMTSSLAAKVRSRQDENLTAVLNLAIGGVCFGAGIKNRDPQRLDVEELLGAVHLLAERHNLEATGFIGNWHPRVDELDFEDSRTGSEAEVLLRQIFSSVTGVLLKSFPRHSASDYQLDQALTGILRAAFGNRGRGGASNPAFGRAVSGFLYDRVEQWAREVQGKQPHTSRDFENSLRGFINSDKPRPARGRRYRDLALAMSEALCDLAWLEDTSEKALYLRPLEEICVKQGGLFVATLNYDNTVESMLSGSTRIDLFRHPERPSKPDGTLPAFHLLKLHGSLDWVLERSQEPIPHSTVTRVDFPRDGAKRRQPAIIFGQRNKLTAEGPFLNLLSDFKEALEGSSRLNIVGYSFRDDHINELIASWLLGQEERKIRIVNPRIRESSERFAISLLTEKLSGRVEVMKGGAEVALEELAH